MSRTTRFTAGAALAVAAVFALSACTGTSSTTSGASSAPMSSPSMSAPMPSASSMAMDPTANLVGTGCAAYASAVPSGSGSVAGMAADPVAVAASNNPLLTTLTAAVSGKLNPGVNLVDTLNGSKFTVFAPVDDAFKKIDPATINALKTDTATLTSILTYHVVPGMIQPDKIVGKHTTVQGGSLEVTGSGNNLKVNGSSAVICGGVQTANAVVYLIDTVLMPPAK